MTDEKGKAHSIEANVEKVKEIKEWRDKVGELGNNVPKGYGLFIISDYDDIMYVINGVKNRNIIGSFEQIKVELLVEQMLNNKQRIKPA